MELISKHAIFGNSVSTPKKMISREEKQIELIFY